MCRHCFFSLASSLFCGPCSVSQINGRMCAALSSRLARTTSLLHAASLLRAAMKLTTSTTRHPGWSSGDTLACPYGAIQHQLASQTQPRSPRSFSHDKEQHSPTQAMATAHIPSLTMLFLCALSHSSRDASRRRFLEVPCRKFDVNSFLFATLRWTKCSTSEPRWCDV